MSQMLITASDPELAAEQPEPVLKTTRPWSLAWRALVLDQRAYTTVATAGKPLKQGFLTLLFILAVVVLARLVGWATGYLTSPRLDSLQAIVRDFVTGLPWYAAQVRQVPEFAQQFAQGYWAGWEVLRAALGIPTPTNVGLYIGTLLLETLLFWFVYGTLAHWVARWLGGRGRWQASLGALGLAYAPLLLIVIEAVPGAIVPVSLLYLAMLAGKFQAIKSVHGFTPGYTLAAVFLPYLLAIVILLALLLFGAAFGIDQVPYADTSLGTFRTLSGLLR